MGSKVSIVITAHNYAKYLPQSLESALGQNYDDFEVVLVNDGSTDHTEEVLAHYRDNPRLKVLTLDGVGLASASNRGIEAATGDYIVRLDADDWFDENLLLVEASYLDRHPNVGLVFCDYYTVDVHGEPIDRVRRAKVNDEVELLDRPALAAGAMYRRKCWEAIGGYNEAIRYQEDYDFWIKFIEKFQVRNVSVPLMFYRQHGHSMSRNWDARMQTRRQVKKRFVEENRERFRSRVLAVIPARSDQLDKRKLAILPFGKGDLLQHCIDKLRQVELVERVAVSTNDHEIAARAEQYGADFVHRRSRAMSNPAVPFEQVLFELLQGMHLDEDYRPDVVVILHPHSPFIAADQVTEAIDSMLLYETDSVIGVVEDLSYHWQVGRWGLTPVGYQTRVVKQEKDLIYKEAGGLYVIRVDQFLRSHDLLGKRIGHIELSPRDALRIQSPFDYWVASRLVEEGAA